MVRRVHHAAPVSSDAAPIGLRLVVIVDPTIIIAVPVPAGALAVPRSVFQLVFGQANAITCGQGSLRRETICASVALLDTILEAVRTVHSALHLDVTLVDKVVVCREELSG